MNGTSAERCLGKAAECERRAEHAIDDAARDSYLRMAENWRLLAKTHQKISEVEKVHASRNRN